MTALFSALPRRGWRYARRPSGRARKRLPNQSNRGPHQSLLLRRSGVPSERRALSKPTHPKRRRPERTSSRRQLEPSQPSRAVSIRSLSEGSLPMNSPMNPCSLPSSVAAVTHFSALLAQRFSRPSGNISLRWAESSDSAQLPTGLVLPAVAKIEACGPGWIHSGPTESARFAAFLWLSVPKSYHNGSRSLCEQRAFVGNRSTSLSRSGNASESRRSACAAIAAGNARADESTGNRSAVQTKHRSTDARGGPPGAGRTDRPRRGGGAGPSERVRPARSGPSLSRDRLTRDRLSVPARDHGPRPRGGCPPWARRLPPMRLDASGAPHGSLPALRAASRSIPVREVSSGNPRGGRS